MCMGFLIGCQIIEGGSDVEIEYKAGSDYYTEKHRPQFHFSTLSGNLADPNGLIYYEDEYHLFHQKNGMWAHAISPDLVHWEHMDIALEHDELGQALSGSAVVDWNDSSGLFDGESGLVAIYTNTTGGEAQSIAYSNDNGRTWERYEGNPVIENPGIKDFRDPKVFWHEETEKWVMIVSTDKSVTFYNSDDLIDWEYQSQFGDGHGTHVAVWECPDLFRLPVDGDEDNQRWVMHVSVGDNEETNGSTAQYFVGEFDGTQFIHEQDPELVSITDAGQDFYAAQSFSGMQEEDGRRVWLGWMANWRYPYQSPTDPWMGSMSIPRELSLKESNDGHIQLMQQPIEELETLRETELSLDPFEVEGTYDVDFDGTNYEFRLKATWEDLEELGIRLRMGEEDEQTIVGVQPEEEKVFLDRSLAGLEQLTDRNGEPFTFGAKFEEAYEADQKEIEIHGFVDESSVEMFINDGETVFTNLIYTTPTNHGLQLYTKGGTAEIEEFTAYHLRSTWRQTPENSDIEYLVVNEEKVELQVGEEHVLTAYAKPDWVNEEQVDYEWSVENEEYLTLTEEQDGVRVVGEQPGSTEVMVKDVSSDVETRITVRVE